MTYLNFDMDDRKLAELEQFCSGTFVPKDPSSVVLVSSGSEPFRVTSEEVIHERIKIKMDKIYKLPMLLEFPI